MAKLSELLTKVLAGEVTPSAREADILRTAFITGEQDSARLNWLQAQSNNYGRGWIARRRSKGGVALHESSHKASLPTLRDAIDRAMESGLLDDPDGFFAIPNAKY